MTKRINSNWLVLFHALWVPVLSGCPSNSALVPAGDGLVVVDTPANVPTANPSTTVCDPFTNDPNHPGSGLSNGVVASIKYMPYTYPTVPPNSSNVAGFENYGVPIDATLFFSDINVPTRNFSLGFSTLSGDVLESQNGDTLYEYFSIHYETQIQLTSANPVGKYQFGVISDDGSVTQINTGSGYQTLLNNDGVHASRFTGATTPVTFTSQGQTFPMIVDYFQGPRYRISMILMWRPWPATGSAVDPLEGVSGDYTFFNPDQNSAPLQAYNDLLSRGWAPVPAPNYALPANVSQNPCNVAASVTTSIVSEMPTDAVTNQASMSISFASNYANATFNCSLDGAALTTCSSPMNYTNLAAGAHQFQAFSSANGKNDSTGANYSWAIRPTTSINSVTPSTATTTSSSMVINFGSNATSATYSCSLDGAAVSSCTSPITYTGLAVGAHSFYVTSTAAGNSDLIGATYSWTVTPSTTITSTTPSITNQTSMTFAFTSNGVGVIYTCTLDSGLAVVCVSPWTYTNLANGTHTFTVSGALSGITGSTAATATWTIDTVLPNATSLATSVTNSSFTATWVTDKPTTTRFSWGTANVTPEPNVVPEVLTLTTSHSVTVNGLSASTFYYFIYGGTDAAGNFTGGPNINGGPTDSGVNRVRTSAQ